MTVTAILVSQRRRNVDNTQYNEVRWAIDVLDGRPIRPGSGDRARYEGVMDWTDYDIQYWHPDGAPPGEAADLPRSVYGFPVVPGRLAAAVRPFVAAGLQTPWLTVFGNHDGLLQGAIAEIPAFGSIATGTDKIIGLGSLDRQQFGWLEQQLIAGSSRYLDASGQLVRQRARDELFVLFSHHTIGTMDNSSLAPGEAGPRALGPEVQDLLLRFPNVVAWVNGHTHINQLLGHARPPGSPFGGGFWEVNTAAHIDWPQQSRLVEIADNRDGTLSVIVTIVDTAAPPAYGGRLSGTLDLASLSRELGLNDWQAPQPAGGVDGRRGSVQDRNAESDCARSVLDRHPIASAAALAGGPAG